MRNEETIREELLKSGNNTVLNRNLAYQIGRAEAIIYDLILYKGEYWKSKNLLDDEGYFFLITNDIMFDTSYSKKKIEKSIKKLIELKLIFKKVKGSPPKNFYKPNNDRSILLNLLKLGKENRLNYGKKLKIENLKSVHRLNNWKNISQLGIKLPN